MTYGVYPFPPQLGATGVTKYQGRDFNYYNKLSVTWSNFGGGNNGNPDIFISDSTNRVQFINLTLDGFIPSSSATTLPITSVLEFSFNGTTIHGELGTGVHNVARNFDDRPISLVWFRIQSGSTGPLLVSIEAWNIR
jgi:hypothetical protein